MAFILVPLLIFIGLLLADFTTACIHWIIDNYASRDWPIIGPYHIAYAHDHHDDPMEMLRLPFIKVHWFIFSFAALWAVILYLIDGLNTVTISALIFGGCANFIHEFSHRPPDENNMLINGLHKLGLFQSPKAHRYHHENQGTHYALLTDYMNPLIERSGLFPFAERCLEKLGLHRYWWERSELP